MSVGGVFAEHRSDLGMFWASLMLLLRESGQDSCAQECWSHYHRTVRQFLNAPDEWILFCGMDTRITTPHSSSMIPPTLKPRVAEGKAGSLSTSPPASIFRDALLIRAGRLLLTRRAYEIHRRHVRRHCDCKEAEHHLIPALLAEMNFLRGIWVGRVVG
jgi:hypothetical protein